MKLSSFFDFSIETLDKIKNYNRPVRMVIWVVVIAFSFIYMVLHPDIRPISPLAEVALIGMFSDLGIYGISRTIEKNTQAKIDGVQNVTNSTLDKSSNPEVKVDVSNTSNTDG